MYDYREKLHFYGVTVNSKNCAPCLSDSITHAIKYIYIYGVAKV